MNLKKKIGVILTGILLGMNILSVNCFADYTVDNININAIYKDNKKTLKAIEVKGYLKDFEAKDPSLGSIIKNYLTTEIESINFKFNNIYVGKIKEYRDKLDKFFQDRMFTIYGAKFDSDSINFKIQDNLAKRVIKSKNDIDYLTYCVFSTQSKMNEFLNNTYPLTLIFNTDNYKDSISYIKDYFDASRKNIYWGDYTITIKEVMDKIKYYNENGSKFVPNDIRLKEKVKELGEYINQFKKEQTHYMPAHAKEIKQNVDEYTKKIKQDLITHDFKESFKEK